MDLSDLLGEDSSTSTIRKKAGRKVASSIFSEVEVDEDEINWGDTGAIDHVLQGRTLEGSASTSIRSLTEGHRKANALKLPVPAGTRVSFEANLGSVMSYEDIPGDKVAGTVVTVRCADGDVTAYNDRVHVMWDDGKFRPIMAEHLRLSSKSNKQASQVRQSFTSFGDLSAFFTPVLGKTSSESDLIHKATKDLWSFRQDGGEFVIERLFSADGNPLKV